MLKRSAALIATSCFLFAPLCHAEVVSFQTGQDGYSGLFDLLIGNDLTDDSELPGTRNVLGSSVDSYFIDGRYGGATDRQFLLRFDSIIGNGANQIAPGARITNAVFELHTSNVEFADSTGPFAVSRLLTDFDESSTYAGAGGGFKFSSDPAVASRATRTIANGFTGGDELAAGALASADVTKIVQAWASGEANLGFAVDAGTTNGWSTLTSGALDASLSPKLTVTFDSGPQAPSQSVTLTQTAGDAGTEMYITPTASDPGDGTLINADLAQDDFLDGGADDTQALLKFNNLFVSQGGSVPDDAEILKATLVINTAGVVNTLTAEGTSSINMGTNGGYAVRQVLTDFGAGSDVTTLSFGELEDIQEGMLADTEANFDITSIVQNWQATGNNFGLNVLSSGTGDGWGILTSGSAFGPRLEIEYAITAVPEPGSLAMLSVIVIGGIVVHRKRRSAVVESY